MITPENLVEVLTPAQYSQLFATTGELVTFEESHPRSESEIIIDFRSRERLEKEFLRDYDVTAQESELSVAKINDAIAIYQRVLEDYLRQKERKWSGGSFGDLVQYLNSTGEKTFPDLNPAIFQVFDFIYQTKNFETHEDKNNVLWNNWRVGTHTDIALKDTKSKQREFFETFLFGGDTNKDPHFLTEYYLDQFIYNNRRQTTLDQLRLPHHSRQHIYTSEGSLTNYNLGQITKDKISVITGEKIFDKTYTIKPNGRDVYRFPGTSFNWSNLEIDYYQIYSRAVTEGLPTPIFFLFKTGKPLKLETLNKAVEPSQKFPDGQFVYPKRLIDLREESYSDESPKEIIARIISKNRLDLLDFLYFESDHDSVLESSLINPRTKISRKVLEQREQQRWTEHTGLKFVCQNLTDVKRVMSLFGERPSDLIKMEFNATESVHFNDNNWNVVRQNLNAVSQMAHTQKLVPKTTFMATYPVKNIFNYLQDPKQISDYYQLSYNLANLNPLQRKVVLEMTHDNGGSLYQEVTVNQTRGQLSRELDRLRNIVSRSPSKMNAYHRLNDSLASKAIMPRKSENLIEFDRFPGFDKKSVLKFSGINLVAKWERNQMKKYKRKSVKYDEEYLPYAYVDSLIKEFLERKTRTELTPEQINLFRWQIYHELKNLPFDTISWQSLQKVISIPEMRSCPPIIIYFYYLIYYLTMVATIMFKKLYLILVQRKINLDITEIANYLTSTPDEITRDQQRSFKLNDVIRNILLDYVVKERTETISGVTRQKTEIEKVCVNFSGPNNFKSSEPIYSDENKTNQVFFNQSIGASKYNLAKTSDTELVKICVLHQLKSGTERLFNISMSTKSFENPKQQEMNHIIFHWLRCLVVTTQPGRSESKTPCTSPEFKYKRIFGPHYTRVTSSVFRDFLGENRTFLTAKDIQLFIGSFSYIFLNSSTLRVLPIYWKDNILHIAPFGIENCQSSQVQDKGTLYKRNINELVHELFDVTEEEVIGLIDKRIGPVPSGTELAGVQGPLKFFNLAFQNVFYKPAVESRDPTLVETRLKDILKNESLEPRGSYCPKMYDFNRWQDYLLKERNTFNSFFRRFTQLNSIFGDEPIFHNPSEQNLYQIGLLKKFKKPPNRQFLDLDLEEPECHQETITEPESILIPEDVQVCISKINEWLHQNGYLSQNRVELTHNQHLLCYNRIRGDDDIPAIFERLKGTFTENDKGANFQKIFNYNPEEPEIAHYTVGNTVLKLSNSTNIFAWTDLVSETVELLQTDLEIYGRLLRYFKHWQSITPVPQKSSDFRVLRDSRKVLKNLMDLSKGCTRPDLLADNFLRVLIISVIPTSHPTDVSLLNDRIGSFSNYVVRLESEVGGFELSKFQDREEIKEAKRLNKLADKDNKSLNKQMRIAPQHLKNEELLRELAG